MEKIAQSKWRKYIDEKLKTKEDLLNFGSESNRNRAQRSHMIGDYEDRKNPNFNKKELKQRLSQRGGWEYGKLPEYQKIYDSPVSELDKKGLNRRLNNIEDAIDDRKFNERAARKNSYTPMKMESSLKGVDPEEYVDIIHGGNKAKTLAFLNGGNGGTGLQSRANIGNGKIEDTGIQVHALNKSRANNYASMASNNAGGSPAVLEGKIKRKYLYPNFSQGQGTDEYGIPSSLFDKIEDAKVYNPNTGEVYKEFQGKNPMSLPYGRTKTPGSPDRNAFKKAPKTKISKPNIQSNQLVQSVDNSKFTIPGYNGASKSLRFNDGKNIKNELTSVHSNIAKKNLSPKSKLGLVLGAGALLGAGIGMYKKNKKNKEIYKNAIEKVAQEVR